MIRHMICVALLAATATTAMAQSADARLDALEKRITRLEDMNAIATPWRPWRTVATWYLWRSLDAVR